MFDWIRGRKKISVMAYTAKPTAVDLFPIEKAARSIPDWWKQLPNHDRYDTEANMKGCAGFLEYYQHGFMIRSWIDIRFSQEHTYDQGPAPDLTVSGPPWPTDISVPSGLKFSAFAKDQTELHTHSLQQSRGFINESQWWHVKIISPWNIETTESLKWYWGQPTWNLSDQMKDIIVLPGVMDFSYTHATHINLLVRIDKGTVVIPAGMPLVHLVPLTDRPVDLRCEFDPAQDARLRAASVPFAMHKSWKVKQKIMQDQAKASRCPFNWKN